jgi:hypothetical protein
VDRALFALFPVVGPFLALWHAVTLCRGRLITRVHNGEAMPGGLLFLGLAILWPLAQELSGVAPYTTILSALWDNVVG